MKVKLNIFGAGALGFVLWGLWSSGDWVRLIKVAIVFYLVYRGICWLYDSPQSSKPEKKKKEKSTLPADLREKLARRERQHQ